MIVQPQNIDLNYLIDPTFTNVNRLLVLSFTRDNAGDNRDSFPDYYLPKVPKDTQQISFIGNLENQDHGATIFFIIEKSEETTFNFLQNSIIII